MYETCQRKADSVSRLFSQLAEGTDVKNDILMHYITKLEKVANEIFNSNEVPSSVSVEDVTQELVMEFWKWVGRVQGSGKNVFSQVGSKLESLKKTVTLRLVKNQCELMDEEVTLEFDKHNTKPSAHYYTELIELKRDFADLMKKSDLFDLSKRHNDVIVRWLAGDQLDEKDRRYLYFAIKKLRKTMIYKIHRLHYKEWKEILRAFD